MRLRPGGVLTLVACASLLSTACGGSGSLSAKSLSEHSKAVQSLAAEGALLAGDSVAGKSTGTYRREHAADLSAAAAKAEKALEHATAAPGLGPKLRELRAVAARVHTELARLGGASKDEQRALRRALEAAADRSEHIGAALE
jgi:hypothetical protein